MWKQFSFVPSNHYCFAPSVASLAKPRKEKKAGETRKTKPYMESLGLRGEGYLCFGKDQISGKTLEDGA